MKQQIMKAVVLRRQDTATRERKRLDGLWSFALDPAGEGRAAQWFAGPLAGAREIAVPRGLEAELAVVNRCMPGAETARSQAIKALLANPGLPYRRNHHGRPM
jgi:hypothetical protein